MNSKTRVGELKAQVQNSSGVCIIVSTPRATLLYHRNASSTVVALFIVAPFWSGAVVN